MMKLVTTIYADHAEVEVMEGSLRHHAYTFDDRKQADSFCKGFTCCQSVINSMVQFNLKYETKKA